MSQGVMSRCCGTGGASSGLRAYLTAADLKLDFWSEVAEVDSLTRRSLVRGAVFGAVAGGVSTCLRLFLHPLLGDSLPLLLAYPTTILVILLRGSAAGFGCAVACIIGAVISYPAHISSPSEVLQAGALLLCVAGLCVAAHRWNVFLAGPVANQDVRDGTAAHWLRAVVLAAMVVPAVIFLLVAALTHAQAERDAQGYADRTSMVVQSHGEETFRSAALVARTIARMPAARGDGLVTPSPDFEAKIRLAMVGVPGLLGLRIEDGKGAIQIQVDAGSSERSSTAQSTPLDGWQADPIAPATFNGERAISLSVPRDDSQSQRPGQVVIFLSAAYFEAYYRSLDSGRLRQARFELTAKDGKTLACWPISPTDGWDSEQSLGSPEISSGGKSPWPRDWSDRLSGSSNVRSLRELEGVPVRAVIEIRRSQVLAGWVSLIGAIAAIIGPVTVWLVCISWVALNRTRRANTFALSLEQEENRRRLAEENAVRNQKWETLATLTGGVAHDFNNLLSILLTNLHVHERRHPAQMAEPQMQSMLRTTRSGVRLTQQILSVLRQQKSSPDTVSLQTWLPTTAELLRATLGAKVSLEYSVREDAGAIAVDVGELELALINLSLNAKHAMPGGGTLTVIGRNARADEGFARPTVAVCARDTGHGIPEDVIPRIFEPFYSTKAKGHGTGLGLSQISAFVKSAGGDVRVESSVGIGTTVHMYFPQVDAGLQTPTREAEQEVDLAGMRLLLVDGNPDVAQAVEAMLASSGLHVVHLNTADAAFAFVESQLGSLDAVLAHMTPLGVQDGTQLARTLRALAPRLPVILMTGHADQVALAIAEGFEALLKPIEPMALLDVLRRMVSARRAIRPGD
jgi:signal transduction histidine kinase/CheY-like chemotaxis protein